MVDACRFSDGNRIKTAALAHSQHKGSHGRAARFKHGEHRAAHALHIDMFHWVIDDVDGKRVWECACPTEHYRTEWMHAVKSCAGPVEVFHVAALEVDHLPKTDRMGKCDPQVKVSMGPYSHTTSHHDKTYKANFHQSFDFPAARLCDLIVEVEDFNYNPLHPTELIGSYTVTAGDLHALMAAGSGAKKMLNVSLSNRQGQTVRYFFPSIASTQRYVQILDIPPLSVQSIHIQ